MIQILFTSGQISLARIGQRRAAHAPSWRLQIRISQPVKIRILQQFPLLGMFRGLILKIRQEMQLMVRFSRVYFGIFVDILDWIIVAKTCVLKNVSSTFFLSVCTCYWKLDDCSDWAIPVQIPC